MDLADFDMAGYVKREQRAGEAVVRWMGLSIRILTWTVTK